MYLPEYQSIREVSSRDQLQIFEIKNIHPEKVKQKIIYAFRDRFLRIVSIAVKKRVALRFVPFGKERDMCIAHTRCTPPHDERVRKSKRPRARAHACTERTRLLFSRLSVRCLSKNFHLPSALANIAECAEFMRDGAEPPPPPPPHLRLLSHIFTYNL